MSIDPPSEHAALRLDQFLKLQGITGSGGQAKLLIQSGKVRINGKVETRRRHKLNRGDLVEVDGKTYSLEAASAGECPECDRVPPTN